MYPPTKELTDSRTGCVVSMQQRAEVAGVSIRHYNSITRAGTEWWSFTTGARAAAEGRDSSVWCCSCQMCGRHSRRVSSGRRCRTNIRRPATRHCGDSTVKTPSLRPPRPPWRTPRTNPKLFVPSFVSFCFRPLRYYRISKTSPAPIVKSLMLKTAVVIY